MDTIHTQDKLPPTTWHAESIDSIKQFFTQNRKTYAPNCLASSETVHWHAILKRQFEGLLIFVLALAAALSFFLGDLLDTLAIVSILLLNGVLGFIQEWKAETALRDLKKMLSPRCRVVRDGLEQEVDAESLIPGDYVLLRAGGAVPADIRLDTAVNLKIDESTLTGESVPVDKDTDILSKETPLTERTNMVWMGTHAVNGHGAGIVVATGMDTEFGHIASLTGSIHESETQLQKNLGVLAHQLGIMALVVAGIVIIIGTLSGKSVFDMLMTGISVAVAAVPEGLPAVVTITLALGVRAMARKKALLRQLQAAETLGAVSVICTDKTGTLTKNEMTVQKIWTGGAEFSLSGAGYAPDGDFFKDGSIIDPQQYNDLMQLLDTGRKCNHAEVRHENDSWKVIGSPTEAALIVAAEKAGLKQAHCSCITAEHSFNSTRKRMSVVEKTEEGLIVHVKGAPETILSLCSHIFVQGQKEILSPHYRQEIQNIYSTYARGGMRTLALARKTMPGDSSLSEDNVENGLIFLGLCGVIDPPRDEVAEALRRTVKAGIQVIMITGDAAETAMAIARQIGLTATHPITSTDMAQMSDEQLSAELKKDVLFSRTVPEDKFRIVTLLQAQNKLVAMTGDGVNDAPALKQADIGIAMGIRGTDVARGAADIVLLDDNFASIVAAIEEGRRQYINIQKFVRFLTSHNIGEVLTIFLNILLGGPLILLPLQILWINLVTDTVTALSLSLEKAERNIMDIPPRAMDLPVLNRTAMIALGAMGLYIGIVNIILFQHYLDISYPLANTVVLTCTVVIAQVLVFSFHHLSGPLRGRDWFSNPWLICASIAMLLLQCFAVYSPAMQKVLHTVPLSLQEWLMIWLVALPLFFVPELHKIWRARR